MLNMGCVNMKKLGLIVPAIMDGGGVPSVAKFVYDAAVRSGKYEVQIFSLAMSRSDPCNTRLCQPASWFSDVSVVAGIWHGQAFKHIGANIGDFEFQRYAPRRELKVLLADCDVLQVVCGSPAWACSVLDVGVPVALQVATLVKVERRARDEVQKSVTDIWRRLMTSVTSYLDNKALKSVDAIQVENPWMLAYSKKLTAGRKVDLRYAPPGVNAVDFSPLPVRCPLQNPYVLCVGRLQDIRKNIPLLAKAFSRMSALTKSTARLVLAGSSAPSDDFWELTESLCIRDRVSYVGRLSRSDLIDLYRHASVFCLSSDEEGLGVVLLEAMACAVPAVATLCGGPDGIITDGVDGYLVPMNDADAMASKMECLLTNESLNLQMGFEARRLIERKYDERIAGEVFVDIWEGLVNRS